MTATDHSPDPLVPVAVPAPPASGVVSTAITGDPLSLDQAVAAVRGPAVGGIAVFLGVVRDHDDGRTVRSLDYSAHPTALSKLRACAERVAAAYDVTAVSVQHRVGALAVGDLAVVVAVSAAHRAPALMACRALIDELKQTVPIWKAQEFGGGTTEWVGLG